MARPRLKLSLEQEAELVATTDPLDREVILLQIAWEQGLLSMQRTKQQEAVYCLEDLEEAEEAFFELKKAATQPGADPETVTEYLELVAEGYTEELKMLRAYAVQRDEPVAGRKLRPTPL